MSCKIEKLSDTLRCYKALDIEMKKLRKPVPQRIEVIIKKYPLVSMILSFLFAIFESIVANLICDWWISVYN